MKYEWIDHFGMAAAVASTSPLVQEVAKAAIVGALSAGVVLYVSDARQEERLRSIATTVDKIEQRLQRMEGDIYRPRWQEPGHSKQTTKE